VGADGVAREHDAGVGVGKVRSDVEEFERHRALLFSIAYRMLGSVADAEDIVQVAYLRWLGADTTVRSPRAYLCTTVTRLAMDHLGSARVRREEYVGPWLPEPLLGPRVEPVADPAELAESISTAFLRILERLAPLERAVFLLREVFGFEYDEVAPIVGREVAACRQIAKRARDRVAADRPRFEASSDEADRIAEEFLAACATGEATAILPLLSGDVVSWTDSGGRVTAARRPVLGADRCARFWAGLARKTLGATRVERVRVNGGPGFVLRHLDAPPRVVGFSISGGLIREIFVFSNPERLGRLPVDS
jgi:RNA polymerase sigma-70 factor (ECF subfamily)